MTNSFDIGDKVKTLCTVYDRLAPLLYKIEIGDVGTVRAIQDTYMEGIVVGKAAIVVFGYATVVANINCFEKVGLDDGVSVGGK